MDVILFTYIFLAERAHVLPHNACRRWRDKTVRAKVVSLKIGYKNPCLSNSQLSEIFLSLG
jgi:hypothetical protein